MADEVGAIVCRASANSASATIFERHSRSTLQSGI
jgi:hypothetical protein